MVATTVLVAVLTTETVLLPSFANQACDPSGDTAAPIGKEPTAMVATTALVVGSMTETVLLRTLATYRFRVAALADAVSAVTVSVATALTTANALRGRFFRGTGVSGFRTK